MRIREVIWKLQFIDKLSSKHGVSTQEAEDVLFGAPHVVRMEKGKVKHEDVYAAFGQTDNGRYLILFFINKDGVALPISARDMTHSERRYYDKQNE